MRFRIKELGPGVLVAAAFIGPGTVTTATLTGAGFGYTLLWAMLFSVISTIILQEMSARLGVITGMGVGDALRSKTKNKALKGFTFALVILAIVIGNAAYEAGNLTGAVLGFGSPKSFYGINPLIIVIGAVTFVLLFIGKYKLIERFLVLLVAIMAVVFFVSAILVQPDLSKIISGLFIPVIPENATFMVLGLIGTTVVPYNLFLHASSAKQKWKNKEELKFARWDTIISVSLGGIITMCIMITSAVAFGGSSVTIESFADLSQQLHPILGSWSSDFIAFGFLAAGFSSSITAPLAAAYATSEILGWKSSFKSWKFRIVWGFVLLTGIVFSSLGFRPTSVILLAQVANGLILPVIAIYLLWIVNDKTIMGNYVNSKFINILGFIVILITLMLGVKGINSALGLF
ncbi:Nramp family divalent metal transporter [Marivirga sp. S37H4]|uniref:Nramp family divalent metal transporter n=1 Tax=Marivirga aurantiaca TaxID=2802615 RepID=A0A935CAV1_9BACT|nr:Nramp family divalent metal transporter [Marivirga aurantiaca]MBK6266412.1 Nramp family divalent metal transporter [Marivirga aurantiaca]